jgi:hypothetical protein
MLEKRWTKGGPKMTKAEAQCLERNDCTLKDFLRVETNRGRPDNDIAKEFGVDRHTISGWKRHYGLATVRRLIAITKD